MGKEAIEKMRALLKSMEEDEKETDVVEETTEEVVEEAEEAAEDEETSEKDLEEAAKNAASIISKELNLEKLDKLFDLLEEIDDPAKNINKMLGKKSVEKTVNSMTKEEIIVGFTKALIEDNKSVIKALSEGTAADGGNLFPDEFRFEIVKRLIQQPRMRSLVRVIPMRRDVMNIPSEGSKVAVSWGTENTAISTTTADFGLLTLTAYRMNSILYTSRELVADATELGVVDLIIDQFADAVGEEEDKVIIQGTGSGQPTGLTSATGHHTVTTSGNLDFDDMIDVFYQLPQQYRNTSTWLVNTANVRELRKITDKNSRYIWIDSPVPGTPATILGRPVIENTWVPEASIFFGDYKRAYYLGDREQMSVETTTEGADTWERHQVGIKVTERIAGITVLADALAELEAIP
ncbi:MAG TPA: phage major capsid protein [Cytophagales bacterium]|jgi:HK97 family phage major capsid protein|nr:phage major capsid protein [Cytophagales bacterium]|tara:strand:- start:43 stop:1263 length:1221 start_codon:yes stop_codon:yes gene_type:complete